MAAQRTLFDVSPLPPSTREVSDPEEQARKNKAPREQQRSLASDKAKILAALRKGSITTWDAFTIGGLRGTARIHELREEGFKIETTRVPGTQGVTYLYTLKAEPNHATD